MRANAINIILIGIAISDFIFLLFYLHFEISLLLISGISEDCIPPDTWSQVLLQLILKCSRDIFRRVSSWLGVIIALIRAIAIRYPTNQRIQSLIRPSKSFQVILSVTLISSIVTSLNFARVRIAEWKTRWVPGENCTMFAPNTSLPEYITFNTKSLADYNFLINQLFLITDGLLKTTPPVVYPFLAGVLIFELKAAQNRRRKLSGNNSDKDTDNTTKVVIWMSVFYFIAEAPTGIAYILQCFFFNHMGLIYLISAINIPFISILIIHCSFNFFICLVLNSQYRITLKSIFGISDKKVIKSRSITVTSQGSINSNH